MLLFSLIDTCSLLSAQLQTLFAIKPKKELLFYFSNDSFEIEKLFLMAVVYVLNTSYLQSCKRMHWMNVFVLKFFFSKLGHLGFQLLLKQTCCHCKKKEKKKDCIDILRWHGHKSNLEFWYLNENTKETIFIDKIHLMQKLFLNCYC
jgi:hypothetical protein